MSTETIVNSRVSLWQRAGLVGLIAAFVVMGTYRLNDCDLFNPDSPRYVIYSQAIVNLGEYRATDVPGTPLYSWRPPGLSLLIAPAMALRPYDVVAAKIVVLVTAALLLCVMFQLTSLHCSGWAALLMTAFVATGPTFLVMATEVLSEVPYTLAVLTILWILGRDALRTADDLPQQTNWTRWIPMGIGILVMAYTPWLRTAGVALVAAVGLWSLTSRWRLKWLSVAMAGVTGLGVLAWRNKQAGGENYVGSLVTRLRERGPGPVIASGIETVSYYIQTIPGLLLPGLTSERSWYAPLTLDGLPKLALPTVVAVSLAALLVLLALLGMYRRSSQGGSLALLYTLIYCACLVIWPWRHERFLWPLIPVMMAFVPAGLVALGRLHAAARLPLSAASALVMLGLCCWQTVGCEQLVRVNHELVQDRDAFHANRQPGFYFSNWRRAGLWLKENTPPSARVLTWHAAVAETSHRFQKRVQFETLSPEKIRQQIEGFSARYLVVPAAHFGDGFGWQQLTADPALNLNVVYHEQDVVILEVEPNRTGQISKTAYPEWLAQQMHLSDEASKRLPNRVDIAMRRASLLRETGHGDEAIQLLRDIFNHGSKTVRVCAELGWMLFDAEQFSDAAAFLDLARTLPNAESIAGQLSDGVIRAEARMKEKSPVDARPSIDRLLNRVKSLMAALKFAQAELEADRLIALAPDNPEVNFVRGKLHHRLGETPLAIECYERAIKRGYLDAAKWLLLIRISDAVTHETKSLVEAGGIREVIDPTDPAAHVRLAELFRDRGWSGRALATLETANERFPNQPAIKSPLADLYRLFARPDLAAPLYDSILAIQPGDDAAKKGLAIAQQASTEPYMASQHD